MQQCVLLWFAGTFRSTGVCWPEMVLSKDYLRPSTAPAEVTEEEAAAII